MADSTINQEAVSDVIGILGAGQLAMMLAQAALRQKVPVWIWANSPADPAVVDGGGVVPVWAQPGDFQSLVAFLRSCTVVLFENEFVDVQVLRRAVETLGSHAPRFLSSLESMHLLQNKLGQKQLFAAQGIPSSRFYALPVALGEPGCAPLIADLEARFPRGFVVKWAEQGYDGKGVFICNDVVARKKQLMEFLTQAYASGRVLYAEEWVDYTQEVAILACATAAGVFVFPLLETMQHHGICAVVRGPLKVSSELRAQALRIAQDVARASGVTGVFAVECFLTADQNIIVNECAPRVHNSGHITQLFEPLSQFSLQVQTALGRLPMNDLPHEDGGQMAALAQGALAMFNLVVPLDCERTFTFSEGTIQNLFFEPLKTLAAEAGILVQGVWYHKQNGVRGRKMGHVNVQALSCGVSEVDDFLGKIKILWNKVCHGELS